MFHNERVKKVMRKNKCPSTSRNENQPIIANQYQQIDKRKKAQGEKKKNRMNTLLFLELDALNTDFCKCCPCPCPPAPPCPEAARARACSPCADRTDVQPVVHSSASPFSKAAANPQPSWHRGRPACIDISWETVSTAVALVEGPVASVDSCSSRARSAEAVAVVVQ